VAVGQPSTGTAEIELVAPDLDRVLYTPGGCSAGLDSFAYEISDGRGGSASATVTVDLTPLDDHVGADLVLSDRAIEGREVFVACQTISTGDTGLSSSADDFRLLAGAEVELRAGESVALGNGTSVADDAALTVVAGP
jgi:hypothetical protein